MCGIAGLFDRAAASTADELEHCVSRMAETLRHRGPDDGGLWSDPAAGISLGQRRLAIIDCSPAGHQPMVSASGRYVMVYNGEVYNFKELARALRDAGHTIQGGSDTAVLLAACAAWGIEAAIGRAIGMFAFALYDREARSLTLARDRLGIKPLYWARRGEVFLFGSELKALRAAEVLPLEIDREALAGYLRFAYVPTPRSIYAGVEKLPPGHLVTIGAGGEPQSRCYWDLGSFARSALADPCEVRIDDVEALLKDAVGRCMVADVPLGAFLSGGIDSSTVVALMQAQSVRPVRTFSIGFREGGYDESAHAKAVAHHLGTEHCELFVTPREALDAVAEIPTWYDEPFGDSSQIPTLLLSRLTRTSVTVALSGDGGDEVFGGYNRHVWLPRLWRRFGPLPRSWRHAVAGAVRALPPAAWDRLGTLSPASGRPRQFGDKLWKLSSALEQRDLHGAYLDLCSQWPDAENLVVGAPVRAADEGRHSPADDLSDPVAGLQYHDLMTYLPDDILTKVDRASMAASLEARVPLLDHRVVELAWHLAPTMKVRGGKGKWLLRQILYNYVPPALVERPKAGFAVPIDAWLRGELRDWAEDLLDEGRLLREGYLDPAPIRERWREHLSGRRNWQHQLWTVLMFQSWHSAAEIRQ